MLCSVTVFQQEAAPVHKACRTRCRSRALATILVRKKTKVSISTHAFAAVNTYYLKIHFCNRVCSVVCSLSYLTPRESTGALCQALLVRVLAHVVLDSLHPAGHRGAQEEFQLHVASFISAFKSQQGSRETLRNFNISKKSWGT